MDPGGPLLRFTPSRRDPLKPGVSQSLVVLHDWPAGIGFLSAGPWTTFPTAHSHPLVPPGPPGLCKNSSVLLLSGLA